MLFKCFNVEKYFNGEYEEWGSLNMEHLNERKRKNVC
jgi:hypothetical protein